MTPENDTSVVACSVRGALHEKMNQIDSRKQDYDLLDLVYGHFNRDAYEARSLKDTYGKRCLSRGEFLKNFFVVHHSVYGYSYDIELARTNKTVGVLVGATGHRDDPLAEYCLVKLTNGESFEFEQYKESKKGYGNFFSDKVLGHTTIRQNGSTIGECRVTGQMKFLGLSSEREWELIFRDRNFGKIVRPDNVSWNNLHIIRPDGSQLPLILAFHVNFRQSVQAMWHTMTLRAFRGIPWPNPDWIVPLSIRPHLTPDETIFYFAVSLLFRVNFGLDDHSGG